MASIVRPTLLKQSGLAAAASKRAFTTKLSTSFPTALSKPTPSVLTRQSVKSAFVRDNVRVAAFHAGGRQQILPAGPQIIEGTANDAAIVPPTDSAHGSYHWTFERLIAVGLIPLTVAPFVAGTYSPATDAILCATLLIHSHIGFESMVTDYIPRKRLPKTRKAFEWLLKGATVLVGVGLYEFETNDVGLTEAVKRVWTA